MHAQASAERVYQVLRLMLHIARRVDTPLAYCSINAVRCSHARSQKHSIRVSDFVAKLKLRRVLALGVQAAPVGF